MPLRKPIPDRVYWFVRRRESNLEWLAFQRFDDDSAMTRDLACTTIYENRNDGFRAKLILVDIRERTCL